MKGVEVQEFVFSSVWRRNSFILILPFRFSSEKTSSTNINVYMYNLVKAFYAETICWEYYF
jgi:hypothetical protein